MIRKIIGAGVAVTCLAMGAPASAGWKLLPQSQPVSLGKLAVTPLNDWNRGSAKPGAQGMAWTQDGFELNELDVFASVPTGQSIYKERNSKRNPMPKFDKSMLLLDLADLFERSFRAGRDVTDFTIVETVPAKLGGRDAVHIRYEYSLPGDQLSRKGEARLAVVGGALYVISFQAPALHYFDAGIVEARSIMDSARLAE